MVAHAAAAEDAALLVQDDHVAQVLALLEVAARLDASGPRPAPRRRSSPAACTRRPCRRSGQSSGWFFSRNSRHCRRVVLAPCGVCGVDDHALVPPAYGTRPRHAARHVALLHLDLADAAGADRRQARVVAVVGDVDAPRPWQASMDQGLGPSPPATSRPSTNDRDGVHVLRVAHAPCSQFLRPLQRSLRAGSCGRPRDRRRCTYSFELVA